MNKSEMIGIAFYLSLIKIMPNLIPDLIPDLISNLILSLLLSLAS